MADDKRKYDASTVFNANFQVGKAAPLDNRDVVRRYAHLVEGIGLNHYMGQVVYVTGEYDSTKDHDDPAPETVNGIVESEVGFYYYKDDTEGWVKQLTIIDSGGSGGGTTIPVDVLPVDVPNGVAPLDENGLVPSGNLPSFVDDVIEGYAFTNTVTDGYYYNGAFYSDSAHTTAITPSTGMLYRDNVSGTMYEYDGSAYVLADMAKLIVFYTNRITNGYYYNGAFYSDAQHTTAITPYATDNYRDIATNTLYGYDGSAYFQINTSKTVVSGYYYNSAFYSDAQHTTLITPSVNNYYIDLTDPTETYYEYNGSAYVIGNVIAPEKSKIYIDLLTEKTYRWSGTVYTEISNTQVSKPFTTNIAVGGVSVGTVIDSTMSLEDVLKKILVNVYQPRVTTNASASIEKDTGSADDVVKIGVKSINYNWKITGNRGTVKRNNGTSDVTLGSYAGAPTTFKLYHTANNTDTQLKAVSSSVSPQTIALSVNATGYFQIDNVNIEIGGGHREDRHQRMARLRSEK